jgi:hypothetical protein
MVGRVSGSMEHLRRTALASVGRACGFAGLAIGCVMVGLSFDPPQMMRAGAILTLLLAIALCLKAGMASKQDYRGTETWMMLPPEHRPPAEIAQKALSSVLRHTYLSFARFTVGVSACFSLVAVGLPYLQSP